MYIYTDRCLAGGPSPPVRVSVRYSSIFYSFIQLSLRRAGELREIARFATSVRVCKRERSREPRALAIAAPMLRALARPSATEMAMRRLVSVVIRQKRALFIGCPEVERKAGPICVGADLMRSHHRV